MVNPTETCIFNEAHTSLTDAQAYGRTQRADEKRIDENAREGCGMCAQEVRYRARYFHILRGPYPLNGRVVRCNVRKAVLVVRDECYYFSDRKVSGIK